MHPLEIENQNLVKNQDLSWLRLALIQSKFNPEVTAGLCEGAKRFLSEKGIQKSQMDLFEAPGAFEIPLLAKSLAKTRRYHGIICLGCVIKGETAHFEWISLGATMGLMQAMLETEVPMSFGILTTYSEAQALDRSRNDAHNKGREAAQACFEMATFTSERR